jgi:PKD repeat protein
MKNSFLSYFLLLGVLVVSCKSKSDLVSPQPKADFSIDGTAATSVIIGTHDALYPENLSSNATSVVWDFGNGTTSTDQHPKVTYPTSGNYDLTLTAFGQGGTKNVIKKNVVVKERILKSIQLDKIYLNSYLSEQAAGVTFPVFSKLDLWVELKFSQGPFQWSSNYDIIAPTIFKTPTYAAVDSTLHSTLIYNLPQDQNVIINYPVGDQDFYQGGLGLVANMYGTDGTNTYLLFSSSWSGFAFSGSTNPSFSNSFDAIFTVPGSPTKLTLNIEFQ